MSDSDIPDDLMPMDTSASVADSSQPLSVRNNNPGNMRPVGSESGFQQFASPEDGINAMVADLHGKVTGSSPIMKSKFGDGYTPTISNIVSTWAPSSENDTNAYISDVASQLGKEPDEALTADDIPALSKAMIAHEGGKKAAAYYKQYASADTGNVSDASVDNSVPDDLIPTDLQPVAEKDIPTALKDAPQQNKVNSIIDQMNAGKMSNTSAALQIFGQGVNKELGDINGVIGRQIPQSVKDIASSAVKKIGSAAQDDWDYAKEQAPATTGAISNFGDAAQDDLDYANEQAPVTMGDINALGNIAKVVPAAKTAEAAVSVAALGAKGIKAGIDALPGDFAGDESSIGGPGGNIAKGIKNVVSPPKVDYDPITTHTAISNSYGAAKTAAKPFYDLMDATAEGQTADATGLKNALNKTIANIDSDPLHEAKPLKDYLQNLSDSIGDDNKLPLSDMVELKQQLNNGFDPKRFVQVGKGATAYNLLGDTVDSSLSDAANRLPDFGKAKVLADRNWLNTVKTPFEDNKILQKFWKPEDYYNLQSVADGRLEELPDASLERAQTMLPKIKTPAQLNAVRRALPDDLADTFSQAKIQHVTSGMGTGRLDSAGKVITGGLNLTPTGVGNTLRNVANVVKPTIKQADKDLISAAKAPSPRLSTKYSQPFQDLKDKVAASKAAAANVAPAAAAETAPSQLQLGGQGKPLTLPSPDLQLEGPKDMIADGNGAMRPMTQAEQTVANTARAQRAELGLTPDVANAQDVAAKGAARDANWSKLSAAEQARKQAELDTMWEESKPDLPSTLANARQSAEDLAAAKGETSLDPFSEAIKKAGFKKGGLIPKFTHQQWTGYLKNGGSAAGHTIKDKNDPVAREAAYNSIARKNSIALRDKLGRQPSSREVEMAHYVGAHGVQRLIKQKNNDMPAHKMFSENVVKDQKSLFFNKNRHYTVGQLKNLL